MARVFCWLKKPAPTTTAPNNAGTATSQKNGTVSFCRKLGRVPAGSDVIATTSGDLRDKTRERTATVDLNSYGLRGG